MSEIIKRVIKEDLTEMEVNVMVNLIKDLYAEPGFSDVSTGDISKYTKIKPSILRGVISSLVKKDMINVHENGSGYQIVYLNESKYYLHPEWSK